MLDAAIASAKKRKAFAGRVHEFLILSDVKLISSELGRDASRAIWILTILLPNQQILTLHAPVRSPHDPYAPQTVMSVVFRVLRYLRTHQLVKGDTLCRRCDTEPVPGASDASEAQPVQSTGSPDEQNSPTD